MDEHLTEKTISTETILQGKVIQVDIEEVALPNGNKSKREIVRHPGAVGIIALTPEKKIVLVKQFRKPLNRVILEIPAGKLETGEEPKHSAKRELEEETGYVCEEIEHIVSFYTSPGFADELVHIYYADKIEQAADGAKPDDDEFVDMIEVTIDEAVKLIEDQKIYDAKTVYAIQYLQLRGIQE